MGIIQSKGNRDLPPRQRRTCPEGAALAAGTSSRSSREFRGQIPSLHSAQIEPHIDNDFRRRHLHGFPAWSLNCLPFARFAGRRYFGLRDGSTTSS
jgi:hypothetical protein